MQQPCLWTNVSNLTLESTSGIAGIYKRYRRGLGRRCARTSGWSALLSNGHVARSNSLMPPRNTTCDIKMHFQESSADCKEMGLRILVFRDSMPIMTSVFASILAGVLFEIKTSVRSLDLVGAYPP